MTDHFSISAMKYPHHHPSFDFQVSVYKSLDEIQNILETALKHVPNQEIQQLQQLAMQLQLVIDKDQSTTEKYPYPFIVVEGLDAVGKYETLKKLNQIFYKKINEVKKDRKKFSWMM